MAVAIFTIKGLGEFQTAKATHRALLNHLKKTDPEATLTFHQFEYRWYKRGDRKLEDLCSTEKYKHSKKFMVKDQNHAQTRNILKSWRPVCPA